MAAPALTLITPGPLTLLDRPCQHYAGDRRTPIQQRQRAGRVARRPGPGGGLRHNRAHHHRPSTLGCLPRHRPSRSGTVFSGGPPPSLSYGPERSTGKATRRQHHSGRSRPQPPWAAWRLSWQPTARLCAPATRPVPAWPYSRPPVQTPASTLLHSAVNSPAADFPGWSSMHNGSGLPPATLPPWRSVPTPRALPTQRWKTTDKVAISKPASSIGRGVAVRNF